MGERNKPVDVLDLYDEIARGVDGYLDSLGSEHDGAREKIAADGARLRASIDDLRAEVAELKRSRDYYENACVQMDGEICQMLGQALGYPWLKDDQKNFPGATEAEGVCVGDHVAETIAMEAARRIGELERERDEARAENEQLRARVAELERERDSLKHLHLVQGVADRADERERWAKWHDRKASDLEDMASRCHNSILSLVYRTRAEAQRESAITIRANEGQDDD